MRSGMRKELWLCANGDILGCAVNHVLSCHGFRFLLIFFRSLLGYLTNCNVAAHSVDSDIFYVVINLSASSKSYIITFIRSPSLGACNYSIFLSRRFHRPIYF